MKRVEVIANQELLADFLTELNERLPNQYYSLLDVRYGKGRRGEANGDGTWPERNFYCILFIEKQGDLEKVHVISQILRYKSPANSLKVFISESKTQNLHDYLKQRKEKAEPDRENLELP